MDGGTLAGWLRQAARPLHVPPDGEAWNLHELDGLLPAGEPRPAMHARIAQLRPVEQNERMGELFDKRNEGELTADERSELYRLGQFFTDLQPILNKAIMSLPPLKS